MALSPPIEDIEMALKLYYGRVELQNEDINSLAGRKMSTSTISKFKRPVLMRMKEEKTIRRSPWGINTRLAFEVWGIDIEEMEKRYKKSLSLKLRVTP